MEANVTILLKMSVNSDVRTTETHDGNDLVKNESFVSKLKNEKRAESLKQAY